jgi:hypothetical protein
MPGYGGRVNAKASAKGNVMYDNSATFALSGSAITILGHGAGLIAVTIGGAVFLTVGAALAIGERWKRRRTGA